MRFKFSKKSFTRIYVNYAKIGSLSHIHYILACDGHFISTSFKDWDSSSYERVSHIYLKRWVQVTPGVTLQSYTFFKPLDLSRSNGQKNTPINANILIKISLIISHLLYFISISKPKKKKVTFESLHFSLSFSPPPLFHLHERQWLDSKTQFFQLSSPNNSSLSIHTFLTNLPQFCWISTTDTKSFITYPHCSVFTIIQTQLHFSPEIFSKFRSYSVTKQCTLFSHVGDSCFLFLFLFF